MGDRKNAAMMLALARDDLAILEEMRNASRVSDRGVGFHAQQAIEKALKAWLALAGVDYPKTHDLQNLFALLAERGVVVPDPFRDLEYLTDYAVVFRYTIPDNPDTKLDRAAVIRQVTEFVEHVERLIGHPAT
jgi:HEPN domain-containing protein